MVRPALTVLALSVMVTALALVVLTIGGVTRGFVVVPVVLVRSRCHRRRHRHLIAHRTGRF